MGQYFSTSSDNIQYNVKITTPEETKITIIGLIQDLKDVIQFYKSDSIRLNELNIKIINLENRIQELERNNIPIDSSTIRI
jgi:hypothetical protein